MSDSFLDHIPSHEQQKLRKRMSPAAYEKLRERVKGPEDLERELKRGEQMAELRFHLETEPKIQDRFKEQVSQDMQEQGIENVVESDQLSPQQKQALEQKKFRVTVSSHPSTHQDQVTVLPEGKVQEAIPVKPSFSEQYVAQFLSSKKS